MAAFDKKLAQEEAWLRQGVKARRTRTKAACAHSKKMRTDRSQRASVKNRAIELQAGNLSAKVVEAKDLVFAYGEKPVVSRFQWRPLARDKIGINRSERRRKDNPA